MNWTPRREKFRAILSGDKCVHPGSVYDPLTARMAEDLGFELGMFAGSTASLTVLGAPDIILLTLTEFAAQALRINRAMDVPLMVDADHGYGNALNVKRTVEELETAGVAGLSIEDTILPQPFGAGDAQLSTIEEGVGKMRAALEGRGDKNLVIAGRTSAPRVTSTEDAIARVTAYEAAGVDAIFVVGVQSRAQLEAIAAAVSLPIILGGSAREVRGLDYLGESGRARRAPGPPAHHGGGAGGLFGAEGLQGRRAAGGYRKHPHGRFHEKIHQRRGLPPPDGSVSRGMRFARETPISSDEKPSGGIYWLLIQGNRIHPERISWP